MKTEKDTKTSELFKNRLLPQKALREAVQKAIRFHKAMGQPIVVCENGKIIEIPPEEIKLLDEPNEKDAPHS